MIARIAIIAGDVCATIRSLQIDKQKADINHISVKPSGNYLLEGASESLPPLS